MMRGGAESMKEPRDLRRYEVWDGDATGTRKVPHAGVP